MLADIDGTKAIDHLSCNLEHPSGPTTVAYDLDCNLSATTSIVEVVSLETKDIVSSSIPYH